MKAHEKSFRIQAAEEEEKTRERVPEGLRRVSAEEQAESLEILRERKNATEAKSAQRVGRAGASEQTQ